MYKSLVPRGNFYKTTSHLGIDDNFISSIPTAKQFGMQTCNQELRHNAIYVLHGTSFNQDSLSTNILS